MKIEKDWGVEKMDGNVERAQTDTVVAIHRQVLGTPPHAGYWREAVESSIYSYMAPLMSKLHPV